MNVKTLHDLLKIHIDSGFGGDEVIVLDTDSGSTFEVENAEADGDADRFIVYAGME